jgi:hypothetical protein
VTRSIAAYFLSAGLLVATAALPGCGSATGHRGSSAADAGGSTSPPATVRLGWPRFFADTVDSVEGNGMLQVRDSATGTLVAEDKHMFGVPGIAALVATGTRSFVIAAPAGDNFNCATRLYRVSLKSGGRPGLLSPLGKVLRGQVWSLAASAHGRLIGYAVGGCVKGQPGYLGILDVRTGRTRQWRDVSLAGESPGNVAVNGPLLSMSADGRLLAFTGWDVAGNWRVIGKGRFTRQVVRVLPTAAASGTLAQRSHVVLSRPLSPAELASVNLSPSARSLYLCTMSPGRNRSVRTVAAYDTATGARLRVIATLTGTYVPTTCQMALDSTGRFLLLTYSLSNPRYPGKPVLRLARIDLTTRTIASLSLRLPPNGGMDPYAGMSTAW